VRRAGGHSSVAMDIRFLTAEDASEWSRLRLEALERDPAAFSSSVEEHRMLPIEEVKKRLTANSHSFVVGAFEDGRLVGINGFHRETGPKRVTKGECGARTLPRRSEGKGWHAADESPARTRHRNRRPRTGIALSYKHADSRARSLSLSWI